MRRIESVLAGATLVAGSLGLSVGAVGAAEEYDFAKQRDFWTGAAQVADFTVYAPSRKDIERAGLEVGEPPTMSSLQMLCAGDWTVIASFDGDDVRSESDASLTLTQAPSSECMDDVGAGDAPPSSWSFKALGTTWRAIYQGCRNIGEGQPDPGVADCAVADRVYLISGQIASMGGSQDTAVRVEVVGMTRPQIRRLIRSMEAVR